MSTYYALRRLQEESESSHLGVLGVLGADDLEALAVGLGGGVVVVTDGVSSYHGLE